MFSSLASIWLGEMACYPPSLSFFIPQIRVLKEIIHLLLFPNLCEFWPPFAPSILGTIDILSLTWVLSTCTLHIHAFVACLCVCGEVHSYKERLLIFHIAWDFRVFLRYHPSEAFLRLLKMALFSKPWVNSRVYSFASFGGVLRAHACVVWWVPFCSSLLLSYS